MGKGAKNGAVTASDSLRTVVDVLDNGILLVDGKGTVLAGNPSAERILGFETDRVSMGEKKKKKKKKNPTYAR